VEMVVVMNLVVVVVGVVVLVVDLGVLLIYCYCFVVPDDKCGVGALCCDSDSDANCASYIVAVVTVAALKQ